MGFLFGYGLSFLLLDGCPGCGILPALCRAPFFAGRLDLFFADVAEVRSPFNTRK